MKHIIGIDPGVNGGIAVLDAEGIVVEVTKMPETAQDLYEWLAAVIQQHTGLFAVYLEKVGGMPGQGGSSAFNFGKGFGWLQMALLALKLPTNEITPQKWQKMYSVGHSSITTSSAAEKKEHKNKLKAKAQQLFPQLGKKVTNATCDALLIAEYGRKQEVGK